MSSFIPRSETPESGQLVPGHSGMVRLTCVNHPQLTWITKNIAPIGCRSFFFDMNRVTFEPECTCPVTDLVLLKHQS